MGVMWNVPGAWAAVLARASVFLLGLMLAGCGGGVGNGPSRTGTIVLRLPTSVGLSQSARTPPSQTALLSVFRIHVREATDGTQLVPPLLVPIAPGRQEQEVTIERVLINLVVVDIEALDSANQVVAHARVTVRVTVETVATLPITLSPGALPEPTPSPTPTPTPLPPSPSPMHHHPPPATPIAPPAARPSKPARRKGVVYVTSIPSGAVVEVDNEVRGHTPLDIEEWAGERFVTVKMSGYIASHTKIEFEAGERRSWTAILRRRR